MKHLVIAAALLAIPARSDAFCGFYVEGSGKKLFADATQVVLMREGTRTVLAMQNDYKGPPEAFAMVIPVPVVLHEPDVKTLPKEVFAKVEQMSAPRLVEYWEQDPCKPYLDPEVMTLKGVALDRAEGAGGADASLGVKIEAQFTVGEYKIVILSAKDSTGLETWLKQEKYKIPEGAEPFLRPYVEAGSKFFVAKVDPAKVKFETIDGQQRAQLSPLRFHYDDNDFTLPIRLGLANSSGTQDLIVNILAPHQRYEVTNRPNAKIPTNLDVKPDVKDRFAEFYAALFDRTLEKNPNAVITEYAWDASSCDPCPGPTLDQTDFMTLGADVLGGSQDKPTAYQGYDFVLTRLHARYGRGITDDLRFKQATPIVGGREHLAAAGGKLEEGWREDSINNFQGRYAIRHAWEGKIACANPVRNRWGGKTSDRPDPPTPAVKTPYVNRTAVQLPLVIAKDVPELGLVAFRETAGGARPQPSGASSSSDKISFPRSKFDPKAEIPGPEPKMPKSGGGCGCQSSDSNALWPFAGVVGWALLRRRPRSRQQR